MGVKQYYNQLFIVVFTLCFLVLCGSALAVEKDAPGNSQQAGTKEYVIGLGDQLRIMVWNEAELSHEMAVRIDGRISLPLLGDVVVAGKTINELALELEKRFGEVVTEPSVTVMLAKSRSWRYYIIGQINQPGEFPIDYPITVLQAIARSGGFQEWAKKDAISLIRNTDDKEVIVNFNYNSFVKGENLGQNITLQPGDTIIVP